jgi:hypothetical protein
MVPSPCGYPPIGVGEVTPHQPNADAHKANHGGEEMKPINEMDIIECISELRGMMYSDVYDQRHIDIADRIQSLTEAQSKREDELVEALKGCVEHIELYDFETDGRKSRAYAVARQAIASSEGK